MLFTINSVITTFANILIGLLVFVRNPKSEINRSFFAMAGFIGLWTGTLYLYYVISDPHWLLFVGRLNFAVPTLSLYYLFKFVGEFPRRTFVWPKWGLIGVAGFTWLLAIVTTFTPLIDKNEIARGSERVMEFGVLYPLWAIYFIGLLFVDLVVLIKKKKYLQGVEKRQLQLLFLGLLSAFGVGVVTNVILPYGLGIHTFEAFGSVGTLGLTGLTFYAIAKHRLMDISMLVGRAVTFTLLLLAVVGIEAGLVWGVSHLLPENVDKVLVAVIGSVAIVMGYGRLQNIITSLTERVFFRGRYDTQELLSKLTKVMAMEIELSPLSQKLMEILQGEMRLSSAKLVSLADAQVEWKGWGVKDKIWIFDEMEEGEMKQKMREKAIAIAIPLFVKDELVAMLTLGPKSSGEVYEGRDLELLTIFASEAAVAIKNAQSYLAIQEFNRTLEARVEERTNELKSAQERELEKTTELLRLKNEFVFMASHDLATPVAAISGYMALIRDSKEKLPSDMQENIKAVAESTDRLKNLVNDLLQIARGESGTMRLIKEKVDLTVLLGNVERRVMLLAKDRQVKLENTIEQDKVGEIETDGQKLMEIMENLLTNAIRYRLKQEGGWIKIRVKKAASEVIVEVEDNGFGIPKAEQSKVFTKFFRSERKEVREQPGTGLGLYVSQMLAENIGGEIKFASVDGQGSTFSIHLKG